MKVGGGGALRWEMVGASGTRKMGGMKNQGKSRKDGRDE